RARSADLCLDFRRERRDPGAVEPSLAREPLAREPHRAALGPALVLTFRAERVLRIEQRAAVLERAVGRELEEDRAVTRAGAREQLARNLVHDLDLLAIRLRRCEPDTPRKVGDRAAAGLAVGERSHYRVEVVLAHECDRQL